MKKIMFNDKYGLTKAVLEGRKSQTRRFIKLNANQYVRTVALDNGSFFSYVAEPGNPSAFMGELILPAYAGELSPAYFIGEEVAIAQSYRDIMRYYHSLGHVDTRKVSEQELVFCNAMREFESKGNDSAMRGDENKMFVRADLMPHRIKITNIRIERLQDISDEDCLKEGIICKNGRYIVETYKGVTFYTTDARQAFAYLIDKVSGKGTWDSNPYVFVYDFELVK